MFALCMCLGILAAGGALGGGALFAAACGPDAVDNAFIIAAFCCAASLPFFLPKVFTHYAPPSSRGAILRLRAMVFWALLAAALFALMGVGMLRDPDVSRYVAATGWAIVAFSVFGAVAAFWGVLKPSLYTPVIYLALFFVWLVVPVSGMEAYMYSEGLGFKSAYAMGHWKWTYFLCAVCGVAALRLLVLRQRLLRPKPDHAHPAPE